MSVRLTRTEVLDAFPALAEFQPDGLTDFSRVSAIIGSNNPRLVWPIINGLGTVERPTAKLSKAQQALIARLNA